MSFDFILRYQNIFVTSVKYTFYVYNAVHQVHCRTNLRTIHVMNGRSERILKSHCKLCEIKYFRKFISF